MAELEEDTISLFRKRVYDMAGVLGKTVKASNSLHKVFAGEAQAGQVCDHSTTT
jgi:hypothetical protein